jgi:hypothetical protein
MHRRPDGTYAGIFGGRADIFACLETVEEHEEVLRQAFAGLPEDWVKSIAQQVWHLPALQHPIAWALSVGWPCRMTCRLQRLYFS